MYTCRCIHAVVLGRPRQNCMPMVLPVPLSTLSAAGRTLEVPGMPVQKLQMRLKPWHSIALQHVLDSFRDGAALYVGFRAHSKAIRKRSLIIECCKFRQSPRRCWWWAAAMAECCAKWRATPTSRRSHWRRLTSARPSHLRLCTCCKLFPERIYVKCMQYVHSGRQHVCTLKTPRRVVEK